MVELVKEHFPHLTIISRARDVDHYIQLRQAGVAAPERETFEGALKSGRMALESLGLGAYEARERADLFRRFNHEMVEEMVAMASSTATERAAVFKRTSTMLTEIITRIVITCRWFSATAGKERKRASIPVILRMNRRVNPLREVELPAILKNF
ncbi:hypothetical protein ACVXG7_18350 [Enterobacter hormaechei]